MRNWSQFRYQADQSDNKNNICNSGWKDDSVSHSTKEARLKDDSVLRRLNCSPPKCLSFSFQKTLPTLGNQIKRKLEEANVKLQKCGQGVPETAEDQMLFLIQVRKLI